MSIWFHKDATLDNFCQMQRSLQPWWLCSWLLCSVYKVKISHHHITSHILLAKAFKYLQKMWWEVPFREISWENVHFWYLLVFKKDFYFNGREIQIDSSKNVKFFPNGNYFPLYISLFKSIRINSLYNICYLNMWTYFYPNIFFIYLNIAIRSNHTFYREEATVKLLSVS